MNARNDRAACARCDFAQYSTGAEAGRCQSRFDTRIGWRPVGTEVTAAKDPRLGIHFRHCGVRHCGVKSALDSPFKACHCERSEAISISCMAGTNPRLLRCFAPRNDNLGPVAGTNPGLLSRGTRDSAPRNDRLGAVIAGAQNRVGHGPTYLLSLTLQPCLP
jgi:hypothetical protein